ncbi:nucleotidyltransferase [Corynebacterium pseudodiphtheriticum]|uniref:nucleotidyltransferase n=1 Tax=Corynebacterium pseudodiphtheriticum TaxID=37637 RepID=UPI00234D0647|nr:nucleotidyltransferase [Corynebacterium pseudodiphtheriticum]MDC7113051.1 nucleotidyltransferase [Corynebacterium pseudodiphtheriticum]MDK8709713.1 nucleotidyltransferase [Corynebacterium pseudodiphtheriticum]
MKIELAANFEVFLKSISLTETQVGRINSAYTTLSAYLQDKLNLQQDQIYLQGSYANGTAIKPLEGGEYDVDVIVLSSKPEDSVDEAHARLRETLNNNGNYKHRIEQKTPCIRLTYANEGTIGFHVDVVPARQVMAGNGVIEIPMRGDGWHLSNPCSYTQWCADQGDNFARTVKLLKRWRDENQTVRSSIKSIILQVLISQHFPTISIGDGERVIGTLSSLHNWIQNYTSAPAIFNPVLHGENLAERWADQDFRQFKQCLAEAVEVIDQIEAAEDELEAIDHWQQLFGPSFPTLSPVAAGLSLGSLSHQQKTAQKGWGLDLANNVGLSVTVRIRKTRWSKLQRWQPGDLVFANTWIEYKARGENLPQDAEVWWQVTNTGAHAASVNGLRGNFFQSHRKVGELGEKDPYVNWERAGYKGMHRVLAVAVDQGRVIAISDPIDVPIWNLRFHRGWR